MDDRWQSLLRVYELRVRQASSETAYRRQVQTRAQATLRETHRLKEGYDDLAIRTSAAVALQLQDPTALSSSGLDAQMLLSYAAGVRIKVQEATASIHRADLICKQAKLAVDEARKKYYQAAARREKVHTHVQASLRAALLRRSTRHEETLIDDRFAQLLWKTGGE
jgi:hypothetical protein